MNLQSRVRFWRKLAQTAAPNIPTVADPTTTTTTTASPTAPVIISPASAPPVSLSQIPTYKANLFNERPNFAQDLLGIINIVNGYLYSLSGGKVKFSDTWTASSTGADAFNGGLNKLYTMAKWLYSVVSTSGKDYSVEGLQKIGQTISSMINGMDFQEPQATNVKTEITSAVQAALNKLGT